MTIKIECNLIFFYFRLACYSQQKEFSSQDRKAGTIISTSKNKNLGGVVENSFIRMPKTS